MLKPWKRLEPGVDIAAPPAATFCPAITGAMAA
jgi:hypothetical protein